MYGRVLELVNCGLLTSRYVDTEGRRSIAEDARRSPASVPASEDAGDARGHHRSRSPHAVGFGIVEDSAVHGRAYCVSDARADVTCGRADPGTDDAADS